MKLPPLPYREWSDTLLTLHLVSQIVGKERLALHPRVNHWWHVTLYVSPRGLTTGAMPYRGASFDVEMDLLEHAVVTRTSEGRSARVALEARPICDFYREFVAAQKSLGIEVPISTQPYKCRSTIPYPEDRVHSAYDRAAVERAFGALSSMEPVFKRFRSGFVGKCSPVHMFWHSFDLAVTRFSGRRAPELTGADKVTREAYSHEVNSAGFWFGDDATTPEPAFYCYTAPAPEGLKDQPLAPAAARWIELGGAPMAILRYEDVRASPDPERTLLEFLQSAYEAGANTAKWDRAGLEATTSVAAV